MRINVIAIGKIKEKFFSDALDEYAKRISRFAELNVSELSEAPAGKSAAERKRIEGETLLARARGHVIAADGGGRQLSSIEFAEYIKEKTGGGISEFSFLIGGSNGLSEEVKKKADFVLSFGRLTYPHQLFRVILAEQIYRALGINAGTPYHK